MKTTTLASQKTAELSPSMPKPIVKKPPRNKTKKDTQGQ